MSDSLIKQRPLHDQVRDAIGSQIRSGKIPPGSRLKPERALADSLGVSRVTVRRALDALEKEGLVRATPGSGRFVQEADLAEPPNALLSFTELGVRRGLTAASRVLGAAVRPASLEEAETMGIAPGADVFELDRLRLLDGVAVAVDNARVPLAVAPGLPQTDFRSESLYDVLERAGAAVARADYSTEACAAEARIARRLGLEAGGPLLLARTTGYDRGGRVVELGMTFYRGDRYRFHATLVREQRPGGGNTA